MSGTSITVAAPPTTNTVAAQILASMAALSGTLTDYNPGSQIRTQVEATGSIIEMQGVAAKALALQAFAYSALAAFNITPEGAQSAIGTLTFLTAPLGVTPPPASQDVSIPVGTIVQTAGGVQAQTTAAAILASGTTSVSVPASAVLGGFAGNVGAAAFNNVLSGLGYPIYVTNGAAFASGSPAETVPQALARFSAAVAVLGRVSPTAVANAPVGVSVASTGETVRLAASYEPWLAAGSTAASGVAGFTVFIDNGTGAASPALIAAVSTALNGNYSAGLPGSRPVGVPYIVQSVAPLLANVVITGASVAGSTGAAVSGAIVSAVQAYFAGLQFASPSEQSQISAAASNAAPGLLSALTVSLYLNGSGTAVSLITGGPSNRIILNSLAVNINP